MEYVQCGTLWDLSQSMGAMGEATGKFFLNQIIEILCYMHDKGTVHRDLKLENILCDTQLNIKLADFGFSRNDNIDSLSSIAGTDNYIAPEIRALTKPTVGSAKTYDGRKADLFSVGVILFLLVKGTYPFLNADEEDFYYSKIISGDADTYFAWVDKEQTLSSEFKDLIWRLLSPQSTDRPSLEDMRNHPWLKNKTT